MKKIVLIFCLLPFFKLNAQTPKEVVVEFFDAFNKQDTKKLKSFFSSKATMVSVFKNKNDSTIVMYEKVDAFINAFANQQENKWSEKISNIKVNQDGDLAQVWCDYEFYLNGKLNHCGVDAFQMIRIKNDWKLIHLADTRRKDCK